MNFNKITPLIVTYNEELNIYNNLKQLINFKKVLVFDQFSKDKTTKIIKKFKNTFVIKVKPQEITKKYNQILLSSKIKTDSHSFFIASLNMFSTVIRKPSAPFSCFVALINSYGIPHL